MTLAEAYAQLGIIERLIPAGSSNRPGTPINPTLITIHNTGNSDAGADAIMHSQYLLSADARARQVSWHYTVDDHQVVKNLPDTEMGWHAGTHLGNMTSIGIEICQNEGIDFVGAADRAALLTAVIMQAYNIQPTKIVPHHYWTGKDCPAIILHDELHWSGGMNEFIQRATAYLSQIHASVPAQGNDLGDDHNSSNG